MIPKSIKKVLLKHYKYDEKEVKEELLADHYIVWICGIDHIVDRTKTPLKLIIHTDFMRCSFNSSYQKKDNIVIGYKDVGFFYYYLLDFINDYYEGKPFEVRIVQIPDSLYYLEFKLDEKYSFVYQQLWELDEEDLKEIRDYPLFNYKEPTKVPFEKIFKKISLGSDMVL